MTATIGSVTKERYEALLDEAVAVVQDLTNCQFRLGEIALEIEPIQPVGGAHGADVYKTLTEFANEVGVEFTTLLSYRDVASRWAEDMRSERASFTVHRTLGYREDRFEVIRDPQGAAGQTRWTCDAAARVAGRIPRHPQTPEERVHRIHDLAVDDTVAATVAGDLLRRPEVAQRVMGDSTARHAVNNAQIARGRAARQTSRERTPQIKQLEHRMEIVNVLGACAAFVSGINRVVPSLHGIRLTAQERETVRDNLHRVRAAADWTETVVDTGDTSMDEQLDDLLRGGQS